MQRSGRNRSNSRSNSRSPSRRSPTRRSRDRRDRSRDRGQTRDRNSRDRNSRDHKRTRDDRSRSRSRERSNDIRKDNRPTASTASKPTSVDAFGRGERTQQLSRSEIEAAKRERLELIRNMTKNDDSDDEKGGGAEEGEEEDPEKEMQRLLGFGGFSSTKGQHVEDNEKGAAAGAVSKHKERKYRQYMNRKGGFNRPLQALK